jgi:hypothetical protein
MMKYNIFGFLFLLCFVFGLQAQDRTEEIATEAQEAKIEQKEEKRGFIFNGMLFMIGWVGDRTNYGYISDEDSNITVGYNFSDLSRVIVHLKLTDLIKATTTDWRETEMYGEVDLLGELGISKYSLLLKLGKFNIKNTYYGEYAMGIGKDYITEIINMDMLNWQLMFKVNNDKLPLSFRITSDFDMGRVPSDALPELADWNDHGLTVSSEVLLHDKVVSDHFRMSLSAFYNDLFFVNEKNGNFESRNKNRLDTQNRTTYIGGTAKLTFGGGPINYILAGSAQHYRVLKNGFVTDAATGVPTPSITSKEGVDYDIGVRIGSYTMMDVAATYQHTSETTAKPQNTVGIETNIYSIPKLLIYMGTAIALEKDIESYGVPLTSTRSRYGWDIGGIYTPVTGVLLTMGYQKMVRFDDWGYYYIKATFWW